MPTGNTKLDEMKIKWQIDETWSNLELRRAAGSQTQLFHATHSTSVRMRAPDL
jgi:hypothetical protein